MNRFGHGLIHHFLTEEWCAEQFVAADEFFVHFTRQIVMGSGVGVKWHCDDDVFDRSFNVRLNHKFLPFLSAPNDAREPAVPEANHCQNTFHHRCHRIRESSNGTATPSQCGITRAV